MPIVKPMLLGGYGQGWQDGIQVMAAIMIVKVVAAVMIVETEVASSAPHPPGHPCKCKLRRSVLKERAKNTRRKAVEIFSTAFFFHLLYPFQLKVSIRRQFGGLFWVKLRNDLNDLFISHREHTGNAEQRKKEKKSKGVKKQRGGLKSA